jgi:extradiol dioxygenase family protein
MATLRPFHLAIPVHNLEACRLFYRDIIGCKEGRSSDHWVDFDFMGHQLVIHYKPKAASTEHANQVDGKSVPVPHFGVVLTMDSFEQLAKRISEQGIKFIIEPYVRFKGEAGEQATMFFLDPAGNALEFKAFKDLNQLFAT